jgi:taurine dioxygenase
MLVRWDNRQRIQQAFNDYQGYRREIYRTTIGGEIPV